MSNDSESGAKMVIALLVLAISIGLTMCVTGDPTCLVVRCVKVVP